MRRWSRLVRGEKSAAEVEGSAEVRQVRQKAEATLILGHGWGQFRSSGAREKLGILRFATSISRLRFGAKSQANAENTFVQLVSHDDNRNTERIPSGPRADRGHVPGRIASRSGNLDPGTRRLRPGRGSTPRCVCFGYGALAAGRRSVESARLAGFGRALQGD